MPRRGEPTLPPRWGRSQRGEKRGIPLQRSLDTKQRVILRKEKGIRPQPRLEERGPQENIRIAKWFFRLGLAWGRILLDDEGLVLLKGGSPAANDNVSNIHKSYVWLRLPWTIP